MLLIAFNQQATIAEAIRGALAQTYQPLEILVSDDASTDATASVMRDALAGYQGPHRVKLLRNEANLGIGAHLSRLVEQSAGELLFVAAGDDVSLPQRCERTVAAWLARGKAPDLIAAPLIDIDSTGQSHGVLVPTDLGAYKTASDWLAKRPYVVGAAQAWSRRLIDRFGPLPPGVIGEDMLMVFRAILSGGAITLDEPLVRYRRGGLSRRRRTHDAADVAERLRTNNRNALVELAQLLADARRAGQEHVVGEALEARLARERFIRDLFAAQTFRDRLRIAVRAAAVPITTRVRLFVYAACPALLAPFFAAKRRLSRPD
jgi:glycosyltransferase involved in cell wall biosynthesis